MILVAIPFYGAPELLPRAIESVLAQTVSLQAVVYADGMEPPAVDPRVIVHRAAVNRGPYFALQAMLEASPYEYFAPIGADDYVDPDHLERMLPAAQKTGAVTTGQAWWHANGEEPRQVSVSYEVGLYRKQRLIDFGAYNPAERVGQDSLLVHLVRLSGPYETTGTPTYHRCLRPGSLSTSAETGAHSPYRNALRRRNRAVLAECTKLARKGESFRPYRESLVPQSIRAALNAEVETLRSELAA